MFGDTPNPDRKATLCYRLIKQMSLRFSSDARLQMPGGVPRPLSKISIACLRLSMDLLEMKGHMYIKVQILQTTSKLKKTYA